MFIKNQDETYEISKGINIEAMVDIAKRIKKNHVVNIDEEPKCKHKDIEALYDTEKNQWSFILNGKETPYKNMEVNGRFTDKERKLILQHGFMFNGAMGLLELVGYMKYADNYIQKMPDDKLKDDIEHYIKAPFLSDDYKEGMKVAVTKKMIGDSRDYLCGMGLGLGLACLDEEIIQLWRNMIEWFAELEIENQKSKKTVANYGYGKILG